MFRPTGDAELIIPRIDIAEMFGCFAFSRGLQLADNRSFP